MKPVMAGRVSTLMAVGFMWGLIYISDLARAMQVAPLTENSEIESAPSLNVEIDTPTTEEDFFKNVKIVLDDGLLLRRDFYTKKNMQKFFAAVNVAGDTEHEASGNTRIWVRSADFDGIFPPFHREGASKPVHDAQISLGLTIDKLRDREGRFGFVMLTNGPSFYDIKKIFGRELTLDKSIPHQPPPVPTGPHANEGWWYTLNTGGEEINGFFHFNSAGFLEEVSFKVKKLKGD